MGPAPFVSEVMHAAPQVYWGPTIRARQMKSDLIGVSGKGLRRGREQCDGQHGLSLTTDDNLHRAPCLENFRGTPPRRRPGLRGCPRVERKQ